MTNISPLISQTTSSFIYEDELNELITAYKAKITKTENRDEVYKWRLIKDFQTKWNEDAEDFPKMLESINFANLVYHQSRGVIIHIARVFPEETRKNFKMLFDESKSLQQRIDDFRENNRLLYDKIGNQSLGTHQDERTIATYLTFRYPSNYSFYKSSFFSKLTKMLKIKKEKPGRIYVQYMEFVRPFITHCIQKDSHLLQLKNIYLDDNCYPDPNNLILAQDILYQMLDQPLPEEKKKYWRVGSTSGTNGPSMLSEMIKNNHISIGWSEIGDLNNLSDTNKNDIQQALQTNGIYKNDNRLASQKAGEISNFFSGINIGDIVVAAEGKRVLAVGEVRGEYEFDSTFDFSHCRAIDWLLPNVQGIFIDEGLLTTVKQIVEEPNTTLLNKLIEEAKEQELHEINELLVSKNIILYGPPGTGKTYELKNKIFKHFINKVTGEKNYDFTTFHQSLSYEDFIEGIKPETHNNSDKITYKVKPGIFRKIAEKATSDPNQKYAIFIDEINRGNVSSVFGELITLIEDDKRSGTVNELSCTLPYSNIEFSVPQNLYIIGTMNTADRSVEALDTALRRRFSFKEMLPQPNAIKNHPDLDVDLPKLLTIINARLEKLLDRDHQIGHSYLINIPESTEPFQELKKVFANKILPLLQEYFYGNYNKIGAVLGSSFVKLEEPTAGDNLIFGDGFSPEDSEVKEVYTLANPMAFTSSAPFRNIYGG
ncbi:AAA family ATPase [Rufibacter aurantiacus]|uniref:AAA family ATPase n=1 Tax=Rufibacter aurantiacus TaxID=2817374 RepID=UPI001B307DCA|nr:AAA family ATPase [Rufibacter aurantiacus]